MQAVFHDEAFHSIMKCAVVKEQLSYIAVVYDTGAEVRHKELG